MSDSCYFSDDVQCNGGECSKCGWNPKNEKLRKERLTKQNERLKIMQAAPYEFCYSCSKLKEHCNVSI